MCGNTANNVSYGIEHNCGSLQFALSKVMPSYHAPGSPAHCAHGTKCLVSKGPDAVFVLLASQLLLFLCVQDPVVARLKDVVDDFKELLPLVQELSNPALQARHWQDIFDIIGASIPTNASGIGRWCLSEPVLAP